jgi:hypothetical protein
LLDERQPLAADTKAERDGVRALLPSALGFNDSHIAGLLDGLDSARRLKRRQVKGITAETDLRGIGSAIGRTPPAGPELFLSGARRTVESHRAHHHQQPATRNPMRRHTRYSYRAPFSAIMLIQPAIDHMHQRHGKSDARPDARFARQFYGKSRHTPQKKYVAPCSA